jgi:hypothetical protein
MKLLEGRAPSDMIFKRLKGEWRGNGLPLSYQSKG